MTTEAMRAQFEAWAAINGFYIGCWTPFEQNYVNSETKTAWFAYQAALSSPAVLALVESCRELIEDSRFMREEYSDMNKAVEQAEAAIAPFTTGATP